MTTSTPVRDPFGTTLENPEEIAAYEDWLDGLEQEAARRRVEDWEPTADEYAAMLAAEEDDARVNDLFGPLWPY